VRDVLKETVGVETMPTVGGESVVGAIKVFNANGASSVHFKRGYIVFKRGYITYKINAFCFIFKKVINFMRNKTIVKNRYKDI
jgi:hypothetical protein